MTNEAKAGMSSLGLATVGLKDGVSSLWDEFKNSSIASGAIQGVIIIVGVLNAAVQTAIIAFKSLWAIVVGAGQAIANVYQNMLSPSAMLAGFTKIGDTLKSSIVGALDSGAAAVVGYSDATKSATATVNGLTEAQKKQRAEAAGAAIGFSKFVAETETTAKDQAKTIDKTAYAAKRLAEDVEKYTKGMSAEQKKAFIENEKYAEKAGEALKKYGKEWDDAQEKAKKTPKGPKPAETYKVDRSNELAETKKQFDSELKLLKDAESTKRELLKDAYAARRINYGQYVASEIELTIESQKKQLAVIEQSSDKRKEVIQSTMQAHVAAFEAELKAGGNAEKLTAKIAAELGNLARQYQTVTVETETQTQALQNATDKRFSEFYKDLAKAVNESDDSLKKFKETTEQQAADRAADLDLQKQLLNTYGAEAEALKASASAMRGYTAEIKKQSAAVAENNKKVKQLESRVDETADFDAWMQQHALINKAKEDGAKLQQNLDQTTETARTAAAQAASDAIVAYNLKVFQEARDGISNALYDAIFEGGSKGGDALKQVLKNMFKNYVINMVINPIVGTLVGSVMGGIGGSVGSAVASGAGSSLLGSAAGSALTSIGALGGAIQGFGTAALAATQTALGMTGTVAQMSTSLAAAGHTAASGLQAGIQAFQAIPGWGWALAGVALVAGLMDFSGETRFGGGYQLDGNKQVKYTAGPGGGQINNKAQEDVATKTFQSINDILKSLDSKLEVVDFYAGLETSGKGKGGTFAGGKLSSGTEFGKKWQAGMYSQDLSAEEAVKQFAEQMKIVTVEALKAATDIPQYLQAELAKVDVTKLTGETAGLVLEEVNRMFTTFSTVKAAFEILNKPMFDTTTAGVNYLANYNSPGSSLNTGGATAQTDPALTLFSSHIKDGMEYWFSVADTTSFSLKPGQQINKSYIFNDLPTIKREQTDYQSVAGVTYFIVCEYQAGIVGDSATANSISTGDAQLSIIRESKRILGAKSSLKSRVLLQTAPLTGIAIANQVVINADTGVQLSGAVIDP